MKKGVVFAVLFVLLLSLSVSAFSFADFFAKFFGGEGLTGSAVSIFQEGSVATLIIEKITCNFLAREQVLVPLKFRESKVKVSNGKAAVMEFLLQPWTVLTKLSLSNARYRQLLHLPPL